MNPVAAVTVIIQVVIPLLIAFRKGSFFLLLLKSFVRHMTLRRYMYMKQRFSFCIYKIRRPQDGAALFLIQNDTLTADAP